MADFGSDISNNTGIDAVVGTRAVDRREGERYSGTVLARMWRPRPWLATSIDGNNTLYMRASTAAHLRALDNSGEDDEEIAEALGCVRALVQVLSDAARTVETKTGLTNAQLFLLWQIRDGREVTVNDLAALAMTSQSTVSIVLSRLERKGLVKRARSPADGRRVILGLTAAGKQILRRAPKPATSEVIRALHRLRPEDLRAVCRGLRALGRELGSDSGTPSMLFEGRMATADGADSTSGRARSRKK